MKLNVEFLQVLLKRSVQECGHDHEHWLLQFDRPCQVEILDECSKFQHYLLAGLARHLVVEKHKLNRLRVVRLIFDYLNCPLQRLIT